MVSVPVLPASDRGKLHMSVVADIEARILSGELPVGSRLPSEGDIARQFGVSTRSVREAMQVLETKGLIRRRHGERAEVVRDDVSQFLDALVTSVGALFAKDPSSLVKIMEVRRMIELEVVGRLAAGEGERSDAVEKALEAMRRAVSDSDFSKFAESDAAFHRALVQSLGNEILTSLHGNLHVLIADVIRVASRVPRKTLAEGLAEHEHLYHFVRVGDVEGARAAMREHIDNSTAYLEQAIIEARTEGGAQ